MTLYRKRDGTYEARYYRDGVKGSPQKRENFGRVSPEKAKALYAERRASAYKRRISQKHLVPFGVAAARYLVVNESAREESILRLHVLPKLATKLLVELTGADIEEWRAGRIKEGAAPATVDREWNAVRAVLRFAQSKMEIAAPALGSVRPLTQSTDAIRHEFLAPREWRALVHAFDDTERFAEFIADRLRMPAKGMRAGDFLAHLRQFPPIFEALLYTCARLGDVLALRWRDVDLDANRLTLSQRKVNGKLVVIPIASPLRAQWKDRAGARDGFVYAHADGSPYYKVEVQRAFAVAAKLAGLPATYTPHTLRHTLGSWLAQQGESLGKIQKILGHSSPVITARHYAHLMPGDLREAIELAVTIAGK